MMKKDEKGETLNHGHEVPTILKAVFMSGCICRNRKLIIESLQRLSNGSFKRCNEPYSLYHSSTDLHQLQHA